MLQILAPLYHAIKICLGADLSCVEIIIAFLSGLVLLVALSNACIITFGFISSCLKMQRHRVVDQEFGER